MNSDPDKLRADVEAFVKTITETGANTNGGEVREQNVNIFPNQQGSDGPKVVLSRSDESASRQKAFEMAVTDAVKNAQAIGKRLGNGDFKVLSITEAEQEKPAPEPLNIYGLAPATPPQAPAGLIEIKVKVIVKCSF